MAHPALQSIASSGDNKPQLDYLGPAEVTEVQAQKLTIAFGNDRVEKAHLALATPYEPVAGDMVLVIGSERDGATDYYVIGVLMGQGMTRLAFDGDVELAARGGKLKLASDQGIEVHAPSVMTVTQKLRSVAETVHRSYGQMQSRIRGLLSVHSGSEQRLTDDASIHKAKRATILTEEEMSINGKKIHLG